MGARSIIHGGSQAGGLGQAWAPWEQLGELWPLSPSLPCWSPHDSPSHTGSEPSTDASSRKPLGLSWPGQSPHCGGIPRGPGPDPGCDTLCPSHLFGGPWIQQGQPLSEGCWINHANTPATTEAAPKACVTLRVLKEPGSSWPNPRKGRAAGWGYGGGSGWQGGPLSVARAHGNPHSWHLLGQEHFLQMLWQHPAVCQAFPRRGLLCPSPVWEGHHLYSQTGEIGAGSRWSRGPQALSGPFMSGVHAGPRCAGKRDPAPPRAPPPQ